MKKLRLQPRTFSKSLPVVLVAIAGVLGTARFVGAQQAPASLEQGPIDVVWVRGPIYMLAGAGANITASIGPDGVLLVDSGTANMADEVLDTIGQIQHMQLRSQAHAWAGIMNWGAEGRLEILARRDGYSPPKPVRYIINTTSQSDHIGGNQIIREAGKTFVGGNVSGSIGDAGEGAAIYAHEKVLFRMVENDLNYLMYPTDTYYIPTYKISHFFNGDGVRMIHMPSTTDGHTLVYIPRSDVIVTGDFFNQTMYPIFYREQGGSIAGVINALNWVLETAVPEFRTEGGTMVVPGHGRVSDSADVGYYRDMVTIVRDNIQEMINRGWTLQQVLAERPTKAYDGLYDAPANPWRARDFVTAVYEDLSQGSN